MSFIAEAVVSATINVLFKTLASSDLLQFARQEQIHADLEKWKKTLVKIQAVLDDAEEKQTTNKQVEIWLGELKNLAYDVEEILDEFATEALRRKLLKEPQPSTSTVRKVLPTCCTGLNPRSLKLNSTMASQIEEINDRLKKIVADKEDFDLNINSSARSNQARYQRPPTTSLNEPHIYGRDNDKEEILQLLLKHEAADAKFSVISIQGMGGLGKTTLAQLVYNDDRVKDHFKIIAWTCVSDDFNVKHLTKTILQSLDPETADINDLNMLQVKLKEKLSGKKFFIVLDDVWDKSYDNWTKLCLPFQAASSGSKIIVTTRDNDVSSMVGALPPYRLKELPYDDCLSIFTYHSLGKMNFNEHRDLKGIGEEIVSRCKGLPLAAKTLGGLLRGKSSSKYWNEALKSNMWDLPEEKSDIIPALRVSYYYLPSHLKRCFAYCSVFPKDYKFCKEELILLWIAEGFLQTQNSKKLIKDLGEEYFDDLHSRSFFQESGNYTSRFVMHDLINDLAQWASKDICLRIDNLQEGKKQWEIPKNLRHLSVNFTSSYGCIQKFEMKSLRTFLTWSPNPFLLKARDFPSALLQLRGLKVLSLIGIPMVPEKIGDLKLLRYLNLSRSPIKFLPNSINELYNLEALILKHCFLLKRLCPDMGNLIKLRYLCIFRANLFKLEGMPLRIGQFTNLLPTPQHFEEVELNGQEGFRDLRLEWTCCNDESNEKQCQKLRSLQIGGYSGIQFPKWSEDTAFSSLVSLTFDNCRNCALLPSVGQLPSLEELTIQNMSELKSLGSEFYGHGKSTPFQSLEQLEIGYLKEWTERIPYESDRNVEALPRLRQLSIRVCPKLQGKLPEHLPSLESLFIENCEQWKVSVPVLPKRCTIEIDRCKGVVLGSIRDCSPLSPMVHLLSGISREMILAEGFSKVGKLDIVKYIEPSSFLKSEIHSSQEFKLIQLSYSKYRDSFLLKEEIEELQQQELRGRCQYLLLQDCKCPVKLEQALQCLNFLRGIYIGASPNINFFPEVALPSQLRFIIIMGCNAIQSLPKVWMHSSNTSLQTLSLCYCHGLSSIGRVLLLPNLKRLEIADCYNLVTVLDEDEIPGSCSNSFRFECLENESCPSQSKSSYLRDSDREIKLSSCSNQASVVSRGTLPMALKSLYIENCPKLVSVVKSFHNNMSLEGLTLINCDRLETLPSGMNNLTSLLSLVISWCPVASIPEDGFPTSLTSLVIAYSHICKSLFEWGLHRLTSLKLLRIARYWDVISFPQEETGLGLPPSLIALRIEEFRNLERLSSIAQNLPCLEYLGLFCCLRLKCLPDDGLPRSLKRLEIKRCPRLKECYEVGQPGYRPKIPQISDSTILHFFWR